MEDYSYTAQEDESGALIVDVGPCRYELVSSYQISSSLSNDTC